MRIKFVQKLIDKIRKKNSIKDFKMFNTLDVPDNFDYSKLNIKIVGKNNKIKISDGIKIINNLTIQGYIDNSIVEINKNFFCCNLLIQLGLDHENFGKIENCTIKIGANSSWENGKMIFYNSNSFVNIGSKCMFAGNVTLYNTDAHPVFDLKTNKIINKVKGITIGDHVWLGMNVTVLKNSFVPNNSIVGWGSTYIGGGRQ